MSDTDEFDSVKDDENEARQEGAGLASEPLPVSDNLADDDADFALGTTPSEDTASTEEQSQTAAEAAPAPRERSGAAEPREISPEQAAYPWYVVHTYSGYELRAKMNLEERIRSRGMEKKFGNILVPQETVVELVRGVKKTSTRKFFPGYILIQVDLDDDTWHLVKETQKITGFVGDSRNPVPLSPEEVENLTRQMQGGAAKPRPRVQFEEGDAVKVIDGPFTDFNGTVDEVKADKGKLRVLISIFGRNTPVELDFVQVEKA